MAYLQGYKLEWQNMEETLCECNIYDTLSGTGTTVFTSLKPSGEPFSLFTVNNTETKFGSPIRALQAKIKFLSTETENLNTFFTGEDNRWLVEYFVNGLIQFKGYLVLDDANEDFLDSRRGNTITLTATDNIGLLKDSALVKTDGKNPRGYYSLIQYVAWALEGTNLNLPINVVHNVKEEHDATKIMYQTCLLHSKTFEKEINESISRYDVLEWILKEDSFITQQDGEWWIFRIEEMYQSSFVNRFSSAGVFISSSPYSVLQSIGKDQLMKFADKSTFVKPYQPNKFVRLIYDYIYPQEIVDNIDFDRGTVTHPTLSPTSTTNYFTVEDWILYKLNVVATDATAFIARYETASERQRYVGIRATAAGFYNMRSNRIPVHAKDKFTISIDTKFDVDISGSGFYRYSPLQVVLFTETGLGYKLHGGSSVDPEPRWSLGSTDEYIYREGNLSEDLTEWKGTVGGEAPPIPADGEIEIRLMRNTHIGTETHYQNLQFDYHPYINGSYQKYRAQHNKISQTLNTKKAYEQGIKISDSPKKLFKGALHIFTGTNIYTGLASFGTILGSYAISIPGIDRTALFSDRFRVSGTSLNSGTYTIVNKFYNAVDSITFLIVAEPLTTELSVNVSFLTNKFSLAGRFYDGVQFTSGVPSDVFLHPFGFNQVFTVWNQERRAYRMFDFFVHGNQSNSTLPALIHRYEIVAANGHAENKTFMLLHFETNERRSQWRGVLTEIEDSTIARDYDTPVEFKYLTDRE